MLIIIMKNFIKISLIVFTILSTQMVFGQTAQFKVNGKSFNMVYVQGGTFMMGATKEQEGAWDNEKPCHKVTLDSYLIGETEVTQELWEAVMGKNPVFFYKSGKGAVHSVSWEDCQTFINLLNAKTGKKFRLPTEAEWEFAARGGLNSRGYLYSGGNIPDNIGWYEVSKSKNKKCHVAKKKPNELGIYDMSGNVYEWCLDNFQEDYYSISPERNPVCKNNSVFYVIRGGYWNSSPDACRVAKRSNWPGNDAPNLIGLRLVLPIEK